MWELTRFGNYAEVILPQGKIKGSFGTFETVDTVMQVAGGVPYDTYGTDIAPSKMGTIQYTAHLYNNTPDALETAYRALTGKRGHMERLFRTWHVSGKSEWIYARLKSVSAPYDSAFRGTNLLKAVTCTWVPLSPHWNGARHGSGWELDGGEYLDSGLFFDEETLDTLVLDGAASYGLVYNNGNTAVGEINLVVTAQGSDITNLKIYKEMPATVLLFEFTGTIPAGEELHINLARKSVTIGIATDAYNNFALGASNPYEDWLLLEPGANHFLIERTGGGAASTAAFNFYDGWA
ncbi:MAG: hypothetical protein H6661_07470 [Ardenticatenaceae bacterium]|nr:hypothetical protein [Ardenticatenaceae bacterium]